MTDLVAKAGYIYGYDVPFKITIDGQPAPYVRIETPRLIIKEFSERLDDEAALMDIISHPKFNFYAFPAPSSDHSERHNAVIYFNRRAVKMRCIDPVTGIRENYKLAVFLKSIANDGTHQFVGPGTEYGGLGRLHLIGYVAVDEVSATRGEKRDIGYFIHPGHWSKGYGTEAATALLNYLMPQLPEKKIMATVHPENAPSIRVLEKLGFIFTGERAELKGEPRLVAVLDRRADNSAPIGMHHE